MPQARIDLDGRSWTPRPASFPMSWRDTRWATVALASDHQPGEPYELEYRIASPGDTPDTGWYLFGGGIFGQYMEHTLAEAITAAGEWVSGQVYAVKD